MINCVNDNCDYFNYNGECSSVCERNGFKKAITNYDRIMSMNLDELAESAVREITTLTIHAWISLLTTAAFETKEAAIKYNKEWLKREVSK